MLLELVHEAHVAWQAVQLATTPTTSTNVPTVGHSATQAPLCKNGAAVLVHVRQSVLVGPEHVPHAALHAKHTLLPLANLLAGVHEARHEPGASKNGWDDAQSVHSLDDGPKQVAQLAWHATHVSLLIGLPPEQ